MKLLLFRMMDRLKLQYLIVLWVIVGILFGIVYWLFPGSLIVAGKATYSIFDAVYFSFVTILTLGYGDISPIGGIRILVIVEGLLGWITFGVIVYKIVSVKEDVILDELHSMSNSEYVSRIRHYLFVSNTNLLRFINNIKTKKKIEKSDIYELSIISTTLEANIADARRFLCRERTPFLKSIDDDDIMLILKSIDLCVTNLINALQVLPEDVKKEIVLHDNIGKIIDYNKRIYSFCNIQVGDKKIDELRELTERLEKYTREK
ncbi:two pore domain potassium channel family protein [Candidatus Pacearchaeota archaeon]|nr:two pore domain potassium channel family protein [Candidatus Pacearchaeota archaeon]